MSLHYQKQAFPLKIINSTDSYSYEPYSMIRVLLTTYLFVNECDSQMLWVRCSVKGLERSAEIFYFLSLIRGKWYMTSFD